MAKKRVSISIWIDRELLDEIGAIAKELKLSRNQLLRNMLDVGLDEIKIQKRLGIVKLALMFNNFQRDVERRYAWLDEDESQANDQPSDFGTNAVIWIDDKLKDEIGVYAKRLGITKSGLIDNIIRVAMIDMRLCRSAELFKLVGSYRNSMEWIKSRWKNRWQERLGDAKEELEKLESRTDKERQEAEQLKKQFQTAMDAAKDEGV